MEEKHEYHTETDEDVDGQYDDYGEYEALYRAAVLYTAKNWGDAPSMEDIENKDFFKDTVPRFIEHDVIHLKVAQFLRGPDARELFDQLKTDIGKVALDRTKFNAKVQSDIDFIWQLFKEELIVLYIERSVLVARYARLKIINDAIELKKYMLEILIPHYITNLCGTSRSREGTYVDEGFLRRFLIHHYWVFIEMYDDCMLNLIFDVAEAVSSSIEVRAPKDPIVYHLEDYLKWKVATAYDLKIIDAISDTEFKTIRALYRNDQIMRVDDLDEDMIILFISGIFFVVDDNDEVKSKGTIRIKKIDDITIFEGSENERSYEMKLSDVAALRPFYEVAVYTSAGLCWKFSDEYDYYDVTSTVLNKPASTFLGTSSASKNVCHLIEYLSEVCGLDKCSASFEASNDWYTYTGTRKDLEKTIYQYIVDKNMGCPRQHVISGGYDYTDYTDDKELILHIRDLMIERLDNQPDDDTESTDDTSDD